MALRLLLDEDTERDLAEKLRHADHDVERVVGVGELGPGATDADVRAYARRTNRALLTHDDDHVAASADERPVILYCPNQRLPSFTLFQIVQEVGDQFGDVGAFPAVVFLTERWLE